MKYHENPYDIDKFINVKELYEKWSEKIIVIKLKPFTHEEMKLLWDKSIGSDRLFNCCDDSRHKNYFMTYDKYAIKYIVGHEITDLTERVYTHRNIDWLNSKRAYNP